MALIPKKMELSPEAVEVLRSAGVHTVHDLAHSRVPDLQRIFNSAAEEGIYPHRFPTPKMFAAWIQEARDHADDVTASLERIGRADLDDIPTARVQRTEAAPQQPESGRPPTAGFTVPGPVRPERLYQPGTLRVEPRRQETQGEPLQELNPEKKLTLFHRQRRAPLQPASYQPDPEGDSPVAIQPNASPASGAGPFSSFEDYKGGRVRVRPLDRESLSSGEDAETDTSEEQKFYEAEQAFKRRMPRRMVRGVQFPHPFHFVLGALVTILVIVSFAALLVAAAVIPFFYPEHRLLLAWLTGALAVSGILYLLFGIRVRCRVCSCHLFFSRPCFKHAKAHRLFGGLPTLCLALHGLLFRWFRCMYCGTAIRLTGRKDERAAD